MRKLFLPALLLLILVPARTRANERLDEHLDEKADLQRMAQEHQHDKPAATQAALQEPSQPVTGEEVTYGEAGGNTLHGYAARPKGAQGSLPGLIVIHEWWGLNDNIRAMTRRLAGEGYQTLAVDLYGGSHAETPEQATKLMNAAMQNPGAAQDNLRRAAAWLEGKGVKRLGVIGWCFGGGWSLNTTLLMPEKIAATVIYYGHLEADPAKLATIRHPVIGFFGAEDKSIPAEGVRQFEAALKKQGTPVEIKIYDGAGHAFANPSGGNYRPDAAKDSWRKTTAFLARNLKGGGEAKK
jgi:carboxymethylenebutenolidase